MKWLVLMIPLMLAPAAVAQSMPAQTMAGRPLTEAGSSIAAPVKLTPGVAQQLQVTVPLAGDQPSATYVFARFGNNQPMQRSNEGYWLPWSGAREDLIDNRLQPAGDSLTFKIADEDLSGAFLPVHFFVAYRAGSSFKYGSFMLVQP